MEHKSVRKCFKFHVSCFMISEYQKQFQFLKQKDEAGKLGHAYILAGRDVQGLKKFTADFVAHINCKFPDVMTVRSADSKSSRDNERDMQEITIEQIRDVQNFLAYKSYYGGYKTVIIEQAERMNTDAADCFLKNLEEPKGQTIIFLICAKPELLRPTIASRCQTVNFLGQAPAITENTELMRVIQGDLAEKFKYAKAVNLDGENFQNILYALAHHFRSLDLVKHQNILKTILDLERQDQISNLNKKLALEVLLLAI